MSVEGMLARAVSYLYVLLTEQLTNKDGQTEGNVEVEMDAKSDTDNSGGEVKFLDVTGSSDA